MTPIPKARDVASVNPADLPRQKLIYATRTSCMRPCAVQLDAQAASSLSWRGIRDSEFIWDFDDGGSSTDSEGFLAAVVYEKSGTYHPTVTVDGETWNPQTITVLDPTRTICVGADFTDCPSTAGGDHFATISAALTATNSEARRHILLKRGGSYGALPGGSGNATLIGAYGSGNKPAVTTSGTELYPNWSYQDLAITASGDTPLRAINGAGALLLRVTVTGSSTNQMLYGEDGFFIVDSDLSGNPYVLYLSGADRMVVKNSTLSRNAAVQHTYRHQGGNKLLVQGSEIIGTGVNTSLTIRGNVSWALIQDNFVNQVATVGPQYVGANELLQYFVHERNTADGSNNAAGVGFSFIGHDMIVRNNVAYNVRGTSFKADVSSPITAQNIWFINNTVFTTRASNEGFWCAGTGCVLTNNLVYSTKNFDRGCFANGGTLLNNWCRSSNGCLDPVTGGSACYEPSFVSTNCGTMVNGSCTNFGFATPGAGTRGINAGSQTVPVWDDYLGKARTTIDVGAVER